LSPAVFFLLQQFTGVSRKNLYVAATAVTGVCYRLCHGIYLSPANILLSDLSPVTSVDFLHDYHKLVNVYCRLGATLQPARQCLLQTFCCSSRHRDFVQIYSSYCHSTQQCIFQASSHCLARHPRCTVHGAHIALLLWRSPLSPEFSKLLLSFPLQAVYFAPTDVNSVVLHGHPIAAKSAG